MNTYTHQTSQQKSKSKQQLSTPKSPKTPVFVDNRAESATQQALQRMADAYSSTSALQRMGPEEEDLMQGKFASKAEIAQRMGPEEEDLMQGKFTTTAEIAQRMGPEEEDLMQGKFPSSASNVQRQTDNSAANNGLPNELSSGIQMLSGMDVSDVRVHKNSSKPAQLNALAYAQGSDIHLGAGQEHHLPHEAWHVVQQRQGRVQPTVEVAGQQVNDDVSLETEADVMGAKALQQKTSP